MTCIAWDGRVLAADRQATLEGIKREVCKLQDLQAVGTTDNEFPAGRIFVTATGDRECGLDLARWVVGGEDPARWPAYQKNDSFNTLIVVRLDRKFQPTLYMYEAQPYRQLLSIDAPFAWGIDGRLALAAMAAGASAGDAVRVACDLSIYSGLGVDTLAVSAL
jgi:hypothetical protein